MHLGSLGLAFFFLLFLCFVFVFVFFITWFKSSKMFLRKKSYYSYFKLRAKEQGAGVDGHVRNS